MASLRMRVALCLMACIVFVQQPARSESPIPIAEVASAADLKAEIQTQLGALLGYMENDEAFAEAAEEKLAQTAGVIACLAQALAEHPDSKDAGVAAPAVRDAAMALAKAKSLADTRGPYTQLQAAMSGVGEGEKLHPWNKLIRMHPMMEELNGRNSKLRRAARRSRDPEADSRHATTAAVLAVAMYADTHEVKNEDDIPKWRDWAREYQKTMTELAAAIKAKDSDKAQELYKQGSKSCAQCHEVFRE